MAKAAAYIGIQPESLRQAARQGRIAFEWTDSVIGPVRVFRIDVLDAYRERQLARIAKYRR